VPVSPEILKKLKARNCKTCVCKLLGIAMTYLAAAVLEEKMGYEVS
jgi:hypothetical protein